MLYKIKFLPGEYFWGGCTIEGADMPIHSKSDYDQAGFVIDEELFIRMAQISALFPMMQFSWAPWKALSKESYEIVAGTAALHKEFSEEIINLVTQAEKTGEPILRNLEYNDPGQGYAPITDEFMMGENLLVCPVVTKGTRRRSVIFPAGCWEDAAGNRYEGRTTLEMDAPLDKLLYFRRIDTPDTILS